MNKINQKIYKILDRKKTLPVLLFLFLIVSYLFLRRDFTRLEGEIGLIEITQSVLILYIFILHIRCRKELEKKFNSKLVKLRTFAFAFILYEEISFLTYKIFPFLSSFNAQSELNIHNAKIFQLYALKNIALPTTSYSIDLTFYLLITFIVLLFLGFGCYLPFPDQIRIIHLEKKYSIYTLIFPFNTLLSSISLHYQIINHRSGLINFELIEYFIYIVFLADTYSKITLRKN